MNGQWAMGNGDGRRWYDDREEGSKEGKERWRPGGGEAPVGTPYSVRYLVGCG
jgi:hypothetical protein